jgi:hypothetical protein
MLTANSEMGSIFQGLSCSLSTLAFFFLKNKFSVPNHLSFDFAY